MSAKPAVFEIPRRQSLATQVAHSIRKAMQEGAWTGYLPSERQLAETFRASRPVVHVALHLLAKERLIAIADRQRSRILPRPGGTPRARNRLVVLITGEPASQLPPATYQSVNEIRAHLAEEGFATEILLCRSGRPKAQQRRVEAFIRQNRVFCCILRSVTRELQEWFSQRSLPALVLGSCHDGVSLPSLDIDYRAVCRHAAGLFYRKGHRRMALVVPESGLAGDLASEQGFLEAAAGFHDAAVVAPVVRHHGAPEHLRARLAALLSQPRPPTALLVAKPAHVFVTLMHLLRQGLRVPESVSVIARDYDPLFGSSLSHYPVDGLAYAHRLSRLMNQMVANGFIPPVPALVFPTYFSGGTVRDLVPGQEA